MCAKIVEIPKQITEQTEHFQLVCKNSSLTGLICYTHFHAAKIMLTFFILGLDTYLQVCNHCAGFAKFRYWEMETTNSF